MMYRASPSLIHLLATQFLVLSLIFGQLPFQVSDFSFCAAFRLRIVSQATLIFILLD